MKRTMLTLAAVLAIVVSGCGKAESGNEQSGGVKTGPGVTADTIKLGSLLDLTAVFAPLSKSIAQGTELYWNETNAAGGVCGRKVEVTTRDHGYDPQKAVSAYRELSGDVLAFSSVLGSPEMAALRPAVDADDMFVGFAGWSAAVLGDPRIQLVGSTYDVEAITGLDHLLQTGAVKSGDKVGHVYFEGDFGENALRGSTYLAGRSGLTIVQQKIRPTDTDLTAQVTALKEAGVKAILVSAGPSQTASVAGVATAVGLPVPIVANGPGFTPQLLKSPAGPALAAHLTVVSAIAPPAADVPGATKLQAAFAKAYPDATPTQVGSVFGYVQAQVMKAVLQQACDDKDLTRKGLIAASHKLSGVDTGGLVAGPLDYTDAAKPPTRTLYLSRPDAAVPGGLKPLGPPVEAAAGEDYQPGS